MRRWVIFLVGSFCCMLWALPVQADLIWEPQDSFYEEHSSECEYVSRIYTANGPDGEVILYESPVSARVVDRWENGFTAYISFTYKDGSGTVWGVYGESGARTGWMPMEYMDVVYDSISFEEEFAADIAQQSGELDGQYLGRNVWFWSYPGDAEGYESEIRDHVPEYYMTYADSQGRTWGKVGYYFGHRNFWICLDQPDAAFDALYPDGSSGIGDTPSGEKEFSDERIIPGDGQSRTALLAALLTALVAGGTAVLLIRESKKKR